MTSCLSPWHLMVAGVATLVAPKDKKLGALQVYSQVLPKGAL